MNRQSYWRAGGGRVIPIRQLTNEHLVNILNDIEAGKYEGQGAYLELRLEAMARGIRWRRFIHRRFQDGELRGALHFEIPSEMVFEDWIRVREACKILRPLREGALREGTLPAGWIRILKGYGALQESDISEYVSSKKADNGVEVEMETKTKTAGRILPGFVGPIGSFPRGTIFISSVGSLPRLVIEHEEPLTFPEEVLCCNLRSGSFNVFEGSLTGKVIEPLLRDGEAPGALAAFPPGTLFRKTPRDAERDSLYHHVYVKVDVGTEKWTWIKVASLSTGRLHFMHESRLVNQIEMASC